MNNKIKEGNYYTVQSFMRNDLKLKGNELSIYAIIFGFTQDGESWFTGSLTYLQDWLGVSKNTVRSALDSLVGKGFIFKDTQSVNGIVYNRYKNNYSVSKIDTGVYQNLDGGVSKIDTNNKEYNILDNINNNIIPSKEKKPYGELNNVMLTDEEYQKLKDRNLVHMINDLSFYLSSKGKKYKSHYATICQWANKDKKTLNKTTKQVGQVI
ncbi:MAG: helix-turn-helix domain-containing protein [Thomasclavelia ramosa]|nr:MAG TPA: helix-turn-helix domain protein [Caudoviricetes sp.]